MRVLIVDDDLTHAEILAEALRLSTINHFKPVLADSLEKAISVMSEKPSVDAVLLDLDLPDSRGPETFRRVSGVRPDIPVIIVSGHSDEDMAYGFIVAGAQDYLVKGDFRISSVARAVMYSCARHTFRTVNAELEQVKASLSVMAERWRSMQEQYRELIISVGNLNQVLANHTGDVANGGEHDA